MQNNLFIRIILICSYPIYLILFICIRHLLFITSNPTHVWHRNSLYFKNVFFPISDIDLTVILSKSKEANKVITALGIIKKIIPLTGEVNIYLDSDWDKIKKNINYFELSRDPMLIKHFNYKSYPSIEQAKCFIIQMLLSDISNLNRSIFIRQAKWKFHYEQIEKSSIFIQHTPKSANDYANCLSLFASDLPLDIFIKKTRLILSSKKSLGPMSKHNLSFYTLFHFPLKAMEWCIHYNELDYLIEQIQTVTEEKCLIIRSRFQWELWGIYTQIYQTTNQQQIRNHLRNIYYVCNKLNWSILSRTIDLLIKKLS